MGFEVELVVGEGYGGFCDFFGVGSYWVLVFVGMMDRWGWCDIVVCVLFGM